MEPGIDELTWCGDEALGSPQVEWLLHDLDAIPAARFAVDHVEPGDTLVPESVEGPMMVVVVDGSVVHAGTEHGPGTVLVSGQVATAATAGPHGARVISLHNTRAAAAASLEPAVVSWDQPGRWTDLPLGLQHAVWTLGAEDDERAPVVVIQFMPEGAVLPRHSHATEFADAVVAGSMDIGGRHHPTGTIRRLDGGTVYGPMIGGPGGCVTLELYADGRGRPADIDPADMSDEVRAAYGREPVLPRDGERDR